MQSAEIEFCIDSYERACIVRSAEEDRAKAAGDHTEGQAAMATEQGWINAWDSWGVQSAAKDDSNWETTEWHHQWKEGKQDSEQWKEGQQDGWTWEWDDSQTKPKQSEEKGNGKGSGGDEGHGKDAAKGERNGKAAGKGKGDKKGAAKGDKAGAKGDKAGTSGDKGSGKAAAKDPFQSASRKLYVGNLPSDVAEDELHGIFGQFGKIEDVYVMQGRSKRTGQSCAMIVYATEADSHRCKLATESGFEVRAGEGDLVVKFADDQDAPGTHMQKPRARGRGRGAGAKTWEY